MNHGKCKILTSIVSTSCLNTLSHPLSLHSFLRLSFLTNLRAENMFADISRMATLFPRFRQLPPELRLKVWEDALPGARTIHLVKELVDEVPRFGRRKSQCTSTCPCPQTIISMLHVCVESRAVVLKRYKVLFTPRSFADPFFSQHFFDPSTDGIFVCDIWPWVRGGNSRPAALYQTRRLSISCNAWWSMWRRDTYRNSLLGKGGLLRFRHLEELNIVFRILTDHERERIMQYNFGQYMRPSDMSSFLRRPHDIAFPHSSVDIHVEPIMEQFKIMKTQNPDWKVPKVKLIAWATRPDSQANKLSDQWMI